MKWLLIVLAACSGDDGPTPDGTGPDTGPADRFSAEPLLDPAGLQNHGGPTPTIALLPGSPAIDQGKDFSGTGRDQRGAQRPADDRRISNAIGGDGSDIGAYEAQLPHRGGHGDHRKKEKGEKKDEKKEEKEERRDRR